MKTTDTKILPGSSSKKQALVLLLSLMPVLMSAQFHLKWKADNENVAFLKKEAFVKLAFELDSFSVKDVPNAMYYKENQAALKQAAMTKFENAFNEESGEKLQAKASLISSAYTYQVKVVPVKYYVYRVEYTPSAGALNINSCFSYYVQADYRIEISDKSGAKPLATLTLTNLTNKYPMSSDCSSKNKYSNNLDEEINRSMIRAGTESAKYILKLIRNSN